eukprot:GHVU01169344.1.p1 GENE.GHVU01169344.1~~GHVU01169344.1.p1  ORF type:complete len:166 (-),score=31.07 GHVU01169344.1:2259-2756(-)
METKKAVNAIRSYQKGTGGGKPPAELSPLVKYVDEHWGKSSRFVGESSLVSAGISEKEVSREVAAEAKEARQRTQDAMLSSTYPGDPLLDGEHDGNDDISDTKSSDDDSDNDSDAGIEKSRGGGHVRVGRHVGRVGDFDHEEAGDTSSESDSGTHTGVGNARKKR